MIYLKNIALSAVLVLSVPSLAYAWSKQGHEWLGQQSYRNLSSKEKAYYDALVAVLKNNAVTSLATLSSLPDKIRRMPLSELFEQYSAAVPDGFRAIQEHTTSRWHYHNTPYKKPPECTFKNKGELLLRLNELNTTLKAPLSQTQEVLLLSLTLHFIQDLHQPLHATAYVDKHCDHDRGGNLICIKRNNIGFCELNLHMYWDQGFGAFEQYTYSVPPSFSEYTFDPESWLQESFQYASTVYALRDSAYEQNARKVVDQRVKLTVQRTVQFLKQHFERRHQK